MPLTVSSQLPSCLVMYLRWTLHALESLCRCHWFLLDVSSLRTDGSDGCYIHLPFCSGNERTVLRGDRPAVLQETVRVLLYQCERLALGASHQQSVRSAVLGSSGLLQSLVSPAKKLRFVAG